LAETGAPEGGSKGEAAERVVGSWIAAIGIMTIGLAWRSV
jgi:hypothetical protein